MQERVISAIHGCSKGKFLLSIDAGKRNFCYPWMQQREVFLLSMGAAKGSFFYPWMHRSEVSAIH